MLKVASMGPPSPRLTVVMVLGGSYNIPSRSQYPRASRPVPQTTHDNSQGHVQIWATEPTNRRRLPGGAQPAPLAAGLPLPR